MTLEAIRYKDGTLEILDQLLLPNESCYILINDTKDGWQAINKMQVRGAPAIAIVGCLSLAVEMHPKSFASKEDLKTFVIEKLNYLVSARPTAVNMSRASRDVKQLIESLTVKLPDVDSVKKSLLQKLELMLEKDISDNKAIGNFGADHIQKHCPGESYTILTHCNTGSLATAGYGTALGVIRSLHHFKVLDHVYCTETRPYNQGARLTAYELVYEKIPSTLICDSMVAAVLSSKNVSAIVVGADRVAANGDTANKIGTLQLAILAKHYNVPFYVAAPWTSIDLTLPNGAKIPIEERSSKEMTHIANVPIAAPGIECWNPAFDVTPADLITGGIVTEKGVFAPESLADKVS